jgi:hypothetical protein
VRRRATFNAKCKAENEMQGQNARAGGKASKEVSAGPVPSQIECQLLYFYVIFASMSTAVISAHEVAAE